MASSITRKNHPVWHVFDARNAVVGRLAGQIATLLSGKHKPMYSPHLDCGDNVVVVNCTQLQFTGEKYEQKLYRWHTGYAGGLKSINPRRLVEVKDRPEEILVRAVSGMLPKNSLRKPRLRRMKLFRDENHPYWSYFTKEAREEFEFRHDRPFPSPFFRREPHPGPAIETNVGPEELEWAKNLVPDDISGNLLAQLPTTPMESVDLDDPKWFESLPFTTLEELEKSESALKEFVKKVPDSFWRNFPDFKKKHPEFFDAAGVKRKDI